jgi:hypothetical protein
MDDTRTTTFFASHSRDNGKRFEVAEVDPVTLSGYMLRLLAALKVPNYESLLAIFAARDDGAHAIDAILQVLQGADPNAVHALITEVLRYVRIAPDPQHPEAWRPLQHDDIRELRTLGDVLYEFVKLNFDIGA